MQGTDDSDEVSALYDLLNILERNLTDEQVREAYREWRTHWIHFDYGHYRKVPQIQTVGPRKEPDMIPGQTPICRTPKS